MWAFLYLLVDAANLWKNQAVCDLSGVLLSHLRMLGQRSTVFWLIKNVLQLNNYCQRFTEQIFTFFISKSQKGFLPLESWLQSHSFIYLSHYFYNKFKDFMTNFKFFCQIGIVGSPISTGDIKNLHESIENL